jgi:hypothetical protein
MSWCQLHDVRACSPAVFQLQDTPARLVSLDCPVCLRVWAPDMLHAHTMHCVLVPEGLGNDAWFAAHHHQTGLRRVRAGSCRTWDTVTWSAQLAAMLVGFYVHAFLFANPLFLSGSWQLYHTCLCLTATWYCLVYGAVLTDLPVTICGLCRTPCHGLW